MRRVRTRRRPRLHTDDVKAIAALALYVGMLVYLGWLGVDTLRRSRDCDGRMMRSIGSGWECIE